MTTPTLVLWDIDQTLIDVPGITHDAYAAVEALDAVGGLPGVRQSVLTGNLYPLAVLKLRLFGFDQHVDLRIGGYGGDAYERTDLPRHAWQRCATVLGRRYTGADTVIVGDTIRDIAAARACGARAVAVATGPYTVEHLEAAGADVVLPDLGDTEATLAAITVLTAI